MSIIKPFKSKTSVQQEAAAWIIKLDKGDLSKADNKALHIWLAQSKTNEREFIELAEVWGLADQLPSITQVNISEYKAETSNQAMGWPRGAIAASIVVCCVFVGSLFWLTSPGQNPPMMVSYHTVIGEIRDVTLSDGSVISLNTNTNIDVNYTAQKRRVTLHKGEAHFKVAKDKQRPFSVEVGDKVVTAVGTAFNIRKSDHAADLVVTEGRVSVDNRKNTQPKKGDASADKALLMVSAGEQLSIAPTAETNIAEKFNPEEVERKLSWTDGMISFENTPLIQAIDEVSRYTERKIIIADEDLKSLKVGGYFKAGETDSMLEVLQLSFNINVQTRDDNVVVLKKNDDHRADQ